MSREQPFRIEQDGYVCRVTMDAHYVSDDDMQRIADTFNQLRRENDELRELARRHVRVRRARRMRKLGIEVGE